jgi:beta-mannosidase
LKYGIEHYRRRKPHCSGTLFWQINDTWPGLSWSVIDYYAFPKAGYFYARRAYAPVMASFNKESDGGYTLWIVNDTLAAVTERIRWGVATFAGKVLCEEIANVAVPANSAQKVARLAADQLPGDPQGTYLFVRARGGCFAANREFRVEVKELARPKAALSVGVIQKEPERLTVHVSSDVYAYFVKLVLPIEGTRCSDNYFDLFPGEERVIEVWNVAGRSLSPGEIEVNG